VQYGVRLTLAYDGTDFAGFVKQVDQRTVQGVLCEAAERVCGHPVTVRAASRTDSGVHALAQVAAFATSRELSPRRWQLALNRYLPPDVSVREAFACDPTYAPRFDAQDKTYRYLFHLGEARDPVLRSFAWHLGPLIRRRKPGLDLAAMHQTCGLLEGTHDFKAFRGAADQREITIRTLLRVQLLPGFLNNPELLALEVHGTAFMLNMVRIIAGTLIDVGRGQLRTEVVSSLLSEEGDRRSGGMTAPAHGLTLVAMTLGGLAAKASRSTP
jgi:tRNA pseudouridine38-40 synthase